MIKKLLKKLFIIFGFGFLVACSSGPSGPEASSDIFNLSTKAQITDKVNETTNNVSIDIFLKKNKAIRLEVTAVLGFSVGSLLMTRTSLEYMVHPQKYFIQGPLAPRVLKPLFKQDVDPVILWSLIHDENLKSHGFQCSKISANTEVCKNSQVTVEVEQRGELNSEGLSAEGQKKVILENNKIKMTWVFKSRELIAASQNETFVLLRPKEYKLITIK